MPASFTAALMRYISGDSSEMESAMYLWMSSAFSTTLFVQIALLGISYCCIEEQMKCGEIPWISGDPKFWKSDDIEAFLASLLDQRDRFSYASGEVEPD